MDKQREAKPAMTAKNLQALLWDEIDKLRNEETTAASLQAITNACGKVVSTEMLRLKAMELSGRKSESDFLMIEES